MEKREASSAKILKLVKVDKLINLAGQLLFPLPVQNFDKLIILFNSF